MSFSLRRRSLAELLDYTKIMTDKIRLNEFCRHGSFSFQVTYTRLMNLLNISIVLITYCSCMLRCEKCGASCRRMHPRRSPHEVDIVRMLIAGSPCVDWGFYQNIKYVFFRVIDISFTNIILEMSIGSRGRL